MKKAAIIILAVLVLAVGGVSAYVAMIDWNEHKDQIAAQFSEVSGKRVVFEGPVSFKIFPSPDLTASNIKIYSREGVNQDVPLATIDRLVAKLSLWPLLKGNFEVKMMSLIEPKILMDVDDNGRLNWQSSITEEQKLNLDNVEIKLDSVLLEKATLNFVNAKHDVDIKLENLNAEVIAPSIFGPYRIEGSYIKDNNPEGFAMSLGRFSESFATSVNFVLNHPTSETFVRFDGSILLKNDAINGNLIVESKKPVDFINKNFKDVNLGTAYDYPLALSMQLDTNKTKASLSNIVVKYGTTAGAGNILIPLAEEYADEDEEPSRRRAEIGFEMTDLDLTPIAAALKAGYEKYGAEGAAYNPQLKFDFIADLKSINTTYNGQTLKNFNLSADYLDNQLTLRNLSATLPGETEFKVTGDVFADNDELTYSLQPEYTTNDLQKLLGWLGYQVNQVTQATYKRSTGDATVEGTLKTVKISPYEISVDKSSFSGNMGIITGERPNVFLEVNADSVNFDNYIPPLPAEEQGGTLAEKINRRFARLGFLNDFDMRLFGKIGLGIYENIPFENTQFDMDTAQGVLTVSKLNVGAVANAAVDVSGVLKGMGQSLQFENLKYSLETKDLASFLNKFALPLPNADLKKLKNFSSKGILTGSPELMAMKTVSRLENIDFIYGGQAGKQNGQWVFAGEVDLKAPDFVQLVNDFNFNYKPKAFSLGIFTLASKVSGTADKFRLTGLNAFVGSNNFKGELTVDRSLGRPNITARMDVNKFELERFFYNDAPNQENKVTFRAGEAENAAFVARPFLDKSKINYDFYKTFDLNGNFKIASLTYKNEDFRNAALNGVLKDGTLTLGNFAADYNGGQVSGNAELGMVDMPYLKGELNLQGQKMAEKSWSGSVYGIKSGILSAQAAFHTGAASEEEMLTGLGADISYTVEAPVVKGWNLSVVDADLKKRDRSDGLAALVQENLQKGETAFARAAGKVKIANAQYVFENAVFEAPGWTVSMTDKGSLDTWDMDAAFTVTFPGGKVKPFGFAMTGPMISPVLTVDVKTITDTYDAHWEKVAADKKAAEDARKAHLKALMDEQQNYAKNIQQRLFKDVIPELEARRKMTTDADILAKYKEIDDRVKEVSKGLDEVIVQGLVPEFDESLPKALGEKNSQLDDRSAGFKNEILGVYEQDVKKRINGFYNKIVDNYNRSKADVNTYRDNYGVFGRRLAMIKTMLDIEQDDRVIEMKKEIEDRLLALDAVNTQVVKDYIFMQNSHDLGQLEDYAAKIAGLEVQSAEDLKLLNEKIEALFKYSEEITSAEEKAYDEKLKQEEIKKKLEENTGKISGARGEDITVTRDIEEIEKMEAAKMKEDIPVLDFSGKTPSGIVKKPTIILEGETAAETDDAASGSVRTWQKLEPVGRTFPEVLKAEEDVVSVSVEKAKEPVAAEPVAESEKPLLKQTLGEISKASGKIIRVDD